MNYLVGNSDKVQLTKDQQRSEVLEPKSLIYSHNRKKWKVLNR